MDDDGEVALDWLLTRNVNSPIILILPGFTGSSAAGYVQKFALNAYECNFQCVVFNYRGLSNLDLKVKYYTNTFSAFLQYNDVKSTVFVYLDIENLFEY